MINDTTFKTLNIPGKNIIKDDNNNLTDIFSNYYTKQEYNNFILNSHISDKNTIK